MPFRFCKFPSNVYDKKKTEILLKTKMVVREERYLATFIFIIHAHLPENKCERCIKDFYSTF